MTAQAPDRHFASTCRERLRELEPMECAGRVETCVGTVIEASGLREVLA